MLATILSRNCNGILCISRHCSIVRATSCFSLRAPPPGRSYSDRSGSGSRESGGIPTTTVSTAYQHTTTTTSALTKTGGSEWIRVYTGSLSERMRMVKVFSLTTSVMGLVAQPLLLEKGHELGGTGVAVLLCGIAGIFTFVTPVLLHLITKKYVVELDFNPSTDEYRATIISIILRRIEIKFRVSDVKVPEVPGMFTSFMVAKRPFFIEPTLFEDPDHYARIMGLDKPIDFKLNPNKTTDMIDDGSSERK